MLSHQPILATSLAYSLWDARMEAISFSDSHFLKSILSTGYFALSKDHLLA